MSGAQLTFDSLSLSADFPVVILQDTLTELTEYFEAILTGVTVFSSGGVQQSLSPQERGRISFRPERARVDIADDNCKRLYHYNRFQ